MILTSKISRMRTSREVSQIRAIKIKNIRKKSRQFNNSSRLHLISWISLRDPKRRNLWKRVTNLHIKSYKRRAKTQDSQLQRAHRKWYLWNHLNRTMLCLARMLRKTTLRVDGVDSLSLSHYRWYQKRLSQREVVLLKNSTIITTMKMMVLIWMRLLTK